METRSLWLVRHGQASFGKSDYDNLSEAGHEQAYLLGKHFAKRGVTPSVVVSGSMKRHRQTLAEIAAGAGWQLTDDVTPTPDEPASGAKEKPKDKSSRDKSREKTSRHQSDDPATAPAPDDDISVTHAPLTVRRRLDERWNELDHRALLTAYKPAYKNMLVLKADMMRTLRPRIAFEDTFEKAVDRWSSGEYDHDYPESFEQFTRRTNEALDDLAGGPEQHAIVVTSAGPVCWTVAYLCAGGSMDAWKHFTLAAVNTGVTRLTIDRHGPHLLTFNEFGHLEAAGLVTNR